MDKIEQSEVERKRIFKTFYLKYIYAYYAYKSIFNVYHTNQKQRILEHRMLYCSNRIKRRFKNVIQRFAPSIEERQINSIRFTFNSIIEYFCEPWKNNSKYIFVDFLKSAADQNIIYDKHINFYTASDKIINYYKKRLVVKEIKMKTLTKSWDIQYNNITQNNILGKGKKVAKLMKKIFALPNDLRDKVLKLHFKFCEIKLKLWFMYQAANRAENHEE